MSLCWLIVCYRGRHLASTNSATLYLLVPMVRFELTRFENHMILSHARLPIPPHRLKNHLSVGLDHFTRSLVKGTPAGQCVYLSMSAIHFTTCNYIEYACCRPFPTNTTLLWNPRRMKRLFPTNNFVATMRFELTRPSGHLLLRQARLPIPSRCQINESSGSRRIRTYSARKGTRFTVWPRSPSLEYSQIQQPRRLSLNHLSSDAPYTPKLFCPPGRIRTYMLPITLSAVYKTEGIRADKKGICQ